MSSVGAASLLPRFLLGLVLLGSQTVSGTLPAKAIAEERGLPEPLLESTSLLLGIAAHVNWLPVASILLRFVMLSLWPTEGAVKPGRKNQEHPTDCRLPGVLC